MVGHRQHEVDALELEQRRGDPRQQRAPAFAVEHVDLRGPRVRADRDLRVLAAAARGRQHAEVGERAEQVDLLLHARLRVVRADDHRVVLEERVEPAGRRHQPLELAVGLRQRVDLRERPVLVRVRVVVGEREEQEVEQVVLDHVLADAAGVLVADARQAELRAARRAARREDVGVEELLRPVHRVAEDLARDPGQRGVARHLVAVAAAVHQVRGAGGADVGVVEPLEHRPHVLRQVLEVHVVDRVGERLLDPERLRGAEARPVLDVAPLAAVVPVHRGDLVLARGRCRWRSTPRRPASPTGTPPRSRRRAGRAPSAPAASARGRRRPSARASPASSRR